MKTLAVLLAAAAFAFVTPAYSQESTLPAMPDFVIPSPELAKPSDAPDATPAPVAQPVGHFYNVGGFCMTPTYLRAALQSGELATLEVRIAAGEVGGCATYNFNGEFTVRGKFVKEIGTAAARGNDPHVVAMVQLEIVDNVPDTQKGMNVFSWVDTGASAI